MGLTRFSGRHANCQEHVT